MGWNGCGVVPGMGVVDPRIQATRGGELSTVRLVTCMVQHDLSGPQNAMNISIKYINHDKP